MTTRTNWFAPRTEFERTRLIGAPPEPPSPPAKDPQAMAAAIIRAGKVARNEIVEDLRPPVGSLGRAILDAAAKARGEQVK
jgi:hypothetical protein